MPVGDHLVRFAATHPGGWRAYALHFGRSLDARIGGIKVIAFGRISIREREGISAEIYGWRRGARDSREGRELLRRLKRGMESLGYIVTVHSASFWASRRLRNLGEAAAEARALDALALGHLVEQGGIRPVRAPRPSRPLAPALRRTDELVWHSLPILRRAVTRAWGIEALLFTRGAPVHVSSIDGNWSLRAYVLLLSPEGVELNIEVQRPRGSTSPPPLVRRVIAAIPVSGSWYGDSRWLSRRFGRTGRSLRAALTTAAMLMSPGI